ncbi:phytase [Alteromonas gilva]|uniref:Phytase n=1 Tax=Alteromonas gilva TaxID=2987522 RepID=A0ABT5L5M7_9ALTE|nr:phytase [Alteromonas gilva]MDC8832345.1 phytase [Alteromonas gilva]
MNPMKVTLILIAGLNMLACSASAPVSAPADTTQLTPISTAGESIQPLVVNNALQGWLITSESTGLHWLNAGGNAISQLPGHIAQADMRVLSHASGLSMIAAIDNNTSALHVVTLTPHTGEFNTVLSVPSDIADRESVCLSQQQDALYVFSSDARGLMSQYLVSDTENRWQLLPVRQFMVGPNISSCAVIDANQTLLIAEEEVGIWHYSADPEGENTRTLDYYASAPEIESVAALSAGHYFTVATDEPVIRQRTTDLNQYAHTDWPMAKQAELKSVRVAANNAYIYLGVFDEAAGQLLTARLASGSENTPSPQPTAALPRIDTITADVQTTPVNRYGDAADDPAIWVNHDAPEASLVLGTDKKFGLNVYSLDGQLQQSLPVGRVNNVDVRYQLSTAQGKQDIAVASNRSSQTLSVFSIANSGKLSHIAELPTTLNDVYGLCTGIIDKQLNVFINDTDGRYQRYVLSFDRNTPSAELVDEFSLPSQPEGCVVDDNKNEIYMGEEARGIWRKDLTAPGVAPQLIAQVGGDVAPDIEGMGIYELDNQRYLVASSQGNNRFAVYALDNHNRLLGTFKIGLNRQAAIDGVSETDGLEVTSMPMGDTYPAGLMVVQDGRNVLPSAPQNFKLINGNKLAAFIRAYR